MNENDLNSFIDDIKDLDPIDSKCRAIDLVNYLEYSGLNIQDYKYLNFYSNFIGILDESGNLKEEYRVHEENLNLFNEVANNSKRKLVENKILSSIAIVDKGGLNVDKYKRLFDSMNDAEFNEYMDDFLNDDDKNFYLEILPNKNEPKIKDIEKLLSTLNVPKEEYVYYKHDGFKDDPIRSREQCSVGYVNVRRLQQILSKKNTYSLDIDNRDSRTGQVTGADKIARISDLILSPFI